MQKLTRRLLILLVLIAALSSTSPVQKANDSFTCEEDCEAQYYDCLYNCAWCPPGYMDRCYQKYNTCLNACPLE